MLTNILKALGVKITPETLAQIEALLPQIPEKVNALIAWNRQALQTFHTALVTLVGEQQKQTAIMQRLEERAIRQEIELLEMRKLLEAR